MVERAPGRRPLSSPRRRRRWPEGQALQGPSVPGHNHHRRTDGPRFKTTHSRRAPRRAPRHPFEIQKSLNFRVMGAAQMPALNKGEARKRSAAGVDDAAGIGARARHRLARRRSLTQMEEPVDTPVAWRRSWRFRLPPSASMPAERLRSGHCPFCGKMITSVANVGPHPVKEP